MGHRLLGKRRVAVNNLVQRAVAEHREPQQREGERDNQRTHHKLADGASARNAGQEQTDKRRPGHPPRPEEERPVVHPLHRTIEGEAVERHAHKAVDVVANVQYQRIKQERRVAHKQHEQNQSQRQRDVQLREYADPFIHPSGDRDGGNNHRQRNQRRLGRHRIRDIKQHAQPVVQLHHTDTERGGDAEDGTDYRRDIHGMPNGPIDFFTENRIERRADGQGQIITIAEVSERHPHQSVHRPTGQAIVEQRPDHRLARGLHRLPHSFRRLHILRDRLGHGEEHQIDADTCGKQHRGPAQQTELGL